MNTRELLQGLHQVALTTTDLDRATGFYRDALQLPLIARFDPPGLAFFDIGGVRLSIQQNAESAAASSVLYFKVADLERATNSLKDKGIDFERDPELVFKDDGGRFGDPGEEEWMAFFRDPDGNLLALVSRQQDQQ
jgi:methylmalonyl-CoA/ethylmalonyl-CoA epimerase